MKRANRSCFLIKIQGGTSILLYLKGTKVRKSTEQYEVCLFPLVKITNETNSSNFQKYFIRSQKQHLRTCMCGRDLMNLRNEIPKIFRSVDNKKNAWCRDMSCQDESATSRFISLSFFKIFICVFCCFAV